jgi:hypothetical protein
MNRRIAASSCLSQKAATFASGGSVLAVIGQTLRELDGADGSLAAARVVLRVKLHLLAFTQALQASAL